MKYVPCNPVSDCRGFSFCCDAEKARLRGRKKGESMKEKLKEITERCFEGDLTLPKVTIWLIGAVCLLGGIVYGLKTEIGRASCRERV